MSAISISQFFFIFTWFGFAALIFLLALIARFYERFSGDVTYYRWYAVPVLLMGMATARYVSLDRWGGDIIGDILLFISGVILSIMCYQLYRKMTGGN